jgi:hypothetical protein
MVLTCDGKVVTDDKAKCEDDIEEAVEGDAASK